MNQTLRNARRRLVASASVAVIALMTAPAAHASGSSMPWEAPLQSILESIEGPVSKILAVIIIIITGLTLTFGDTSGASSRSSSVCRSRSRRARSSCPSSPSAAERSSDGGWSGTGRGVARLSVPVHRALTEPILLGGAPRAIAIMNGTLAGAIGLGLRLWLAGIAIWAIGHLVAAWRLRRQFGHP